jgi:cytochrome c oxidase cbb3-type subunit 3
VSKNDDQVLGHGNEADGIEEYDNPLPDWWIGLFFACIAWGVAYGVEWHFISHKSQAALYDQEVAAAKAQWPDLDKPAGMDSSPATLALGGETFTANCVACHGADLHGGIGPNLTDGTWIHGGTYEEVVKTITDGVSAKGMPTWGPLLGPKKISAVASFVLSKNEGGGATGAAPSPEGAAPTATADAAGSSTPTEGATPAVPQ